MNQKSGGEVAIGIRDDDVYIIYRKNKKEKWNIIPIREIADT